MQKAKLLPIYFEEANPREREELAAQMECLQSLYGEVAAFLPPVPLGAPMPQADALLFPQMLFAAYRHDGFFKGLSLPLVVLTSRFGTVEMWDWEIVTYLRDLGCTVFSPYSVPLAKTILRGLAVKSSLRQGAKFLLFQDSPGEGMQANIFKRFYWWEKQSTEKMREAFGCQILYRSWKAVCGQARAIPDGRAKALCADWDVPREGVSEGDYLKAVKLYMAVKEEIGQLGGVAGVGANCLNESFHCDTTPCLAWDMLFERDGVVWACEGDTLSLLTTYILYHSLGRPVMMTNLYPFLMGMAALAHEGIDRFPQVEDSDNCALGVHCGYFGFLPRKFSAAWTLRPKVLAIVNEAATMVDARLPLGDVTLAKLYPGFQRLSVIPAKLEAYVQYEGSDCRNGALFRYGDGHKVMDALCSHHALVVAGDVKTELTQLARLFQWEAMVLS